MLVQIKDLNGRWSSDKQGNPTWGAHLVQVPWTLEELLSYRQIIQTWVDEQGRSYNPGHGGIGLQAMSALVSTGLTLDEAKALLKQPSMYPEPLSGPAIGAHVLWGCIRIQLREATLDNPTTKWSKPIKAIKIGGESNDAA